MAGHAQVAAARKATEYPYSGTHDKVIFEREYSARFASVPKFNKPSIPDLIFVLTKLEHDKRITDTRWAAYLLATTFVESSRTRRIHQTLTGPKGLPTEREMKVWRNFAPVEEAGHGRGHGYFLPVKVARLPNGDAQVTEWDGDQWIVSSTTGDLDEVRRNAKRGIKRPGLPASAAYAGDDGEEQSYFGRGYVQLTWWDNYVSAGFAINRGLDFLFKPDLMLDRDLAYLIMATGMITGKSFANGRTFARYFVGGRTDYVEARKMVNPGAKQANKVEVAEIARRFEDVLFASRAAPSVVTVK